MILAWASLFNSNLPPEDNLKLKGVIWKWAVSIFKVDPVVI